VAGCGYGTYGDKVASNILNSYPNNGLVYTARIGLSFVVIFSYPIQAIALRISAASLFQVIKGCFNKDTALAKSAFPGEPKKYDKQTTLQKSLSCFELNPIYLIPTVIFIAFTALIGFALDDLGVVVDITGAIGAATIAFTAPGVMFFLIFPERKVMHWIAAFAVVFGIFVLVSGVILVFI